MTDKKQYSIWAAFMVASLATAFAAAGAVSAGQTGSGKMHCEIAASSAHGVVKLEGRAHALEALSGSWRFNVEGAGAHISQSGEFDAAAGATSKLGSAQLGGGGPYEARLEIGAHGQMAQCAEWTGPAL